MGIRQQMGGSGSGSPACNSSDILSLIGEAALLVKNGKIKYLNSAAKEFLGSCEGKSLLALFGTQVAEVQAPSFVTGVIIGGKRCILRTCSIGGDRVLFIRTQELPPAILNEPFLCCMRNSLMAIGMSADSIRTAAENSGSSEILEYAATLTRSQFRLIRLLENATLVLGFSNGSAILNDCEVDFSKLCGSLVDEASFFLPGIEFHTSLGGSITCAADPAMLRQLLMNLISNCLVHASGCSNISISLAETADSVILSVSNDGQGIQPEKLHTIFDRYRYNFDLMAMNSGAGMGLTVVRCIAEAHGGTLLLESRPDRGTAVRVSFNRRRRPGMGLHSPQAEYRPSKDVLIGLSDCLEANCYTEKYMD